MLELGDAPSDQLPELKLALEPLKVLIARLIVIVSFTGALVPLALVAVRLILEVVPSSVGVPMILPVAESKLSPAGRLPVKA